MRQNKRNNTVRQSLTFALVMLPALVIGLFSYWKLHQYLTENTYSRRSSIAKLASTLLVERFDRVYDVGISLSTRVTFRELMEAGRWSEARTIVEDIPGKFPFIDHLVLTDILERQKPMCPLILG